MALKQGDVLAGKYRVERELGQGGMGAVFIATNTVLQRQVALKVMTGAFATVPAAVERFHREAIAASRVSHPSIVQVFDAGNHEGQPWIAMELLEGESLGDRLVRGPLSLDEVMHMATGALSALAEVHEQGIVHRDLKPDNIFLAKDKRSGFIPKVLDFGVAKDTSGDQLNKLTATGAVVGTAYYLSPEQAKGSPNIDARADVYAMGVVLFECLSGNMPYEADTITQLIAKMFTEAPRTLTEVAPHIPSPIADVVTTCLQQSPAHRYQSARELLAALEQAVAVSRGQMPAPIAYAGTMQGLPGTAGSHPGVAHPGALAGTAVGHTPGGHVPSAPGYAHTGPGVVAPSHPGLPSQPGMMAPGSQPGVPMGSYPGMPPGSQPGVPMGSHPGMVQQGFPGTAPGLAPGPYAAPVAVLPVGTSPGYAPAAPPEESAGGKLAMIAIVGVLFLVGAGATGGVAWFVMSGEDGEAVASAEATTASSPPPSEPQPPNAVPAPAPEVPAPDVAQAPEEAPNDAVAQAPLTDGEPARDDEGSGSSQRSRRSAPSHDDDRAAAEPSPAASEDATPAATPDPAPAERPASNDSREAAPPRPAAPAAGITPAQIAGAINQRRAYAQERCFERRRRRVPNLGGIVTIGFVVRPDGRADDVTVVHNGSGDEWFGRCIGNVVRSIRFPQATNGRDTPARYPFRF